MLDASPQLVAIATAAAAGGLRPAGHPANDAQVIDFTLSSQIDSTPLFGSNGSCPADVTIAGKWVIAFSRMCDSLHVLGFALQGFAYLIALFVVFRRRD